MNARLAGLLVVLLVLIGGGALLYYEQGQSRRPAAVGILGQPLLKGLQAADVASISIREPGATITLERKDAAWIVAERAGFPADVARVRELVLKAIELKVGQTEPIGDADRARLKLDGSATRVEFRSAEGKVQAALLAGNKYFKREPEQPDKAIGDGRFVMLPEQDKTLYVVSDPLALATVNSAEWVSKTGFAAERVKTLEVLPAPGEGWRIERTSDSADWKLSGARPGETLEITRANAAAYSLSRVELADVAPGDVKPEVTGLAHPVVVRASTFDGLVYTLKIGKLRGEHHYALVAVEGKPQPEGKDADERARKLAERLPREMALSGHILLIAKSKLEDILKPRSELLAKKEDTKKRK